VIVQRRTVVCPAVTPVTVVVGEDGVVIAPAPLVIVHTPVPDTAVLPARVNVLVAHWAWSVPAAATVTAASLVSDTSSLLVQLPFVIVQRRAVVCPAVTPVTVVVGEDASVIAPAPLVIVHTPVPTRTVLPARVKVEVAHCVWSVPAAATVTAASLVRDTSSLLVQLPFVIVQRRIVVCPAVTPVTVVVGEDGVVIAPAPLCIVHIPVPTRAVLPARVKVEVAHWVWSVPAAATVTAASFVSDTSSFVEQVPFVIVQRRTVVLPAVTPVTVVVLSDASVIVPGPLTIVHKPVPVVGLLPANVNVLVAHCD
jgi:hypothetical protein